MLFKNKEKNEIGKKESQHLSQSVDSSEITPASLNIWLLTTGQGQEGECGAPNFPRDLHWNTFPSSKQYQNLDSSIHCLTTVLEKSWQSASFVYLKLATQLCVVFISMSFRWNLGFPQVHQLPIALFPTRLCIWITFLIFINFWFVPRTFILGNMNKGVKEIHGISLLPWEAHCYFIPFSENLNRNRIECSFMGMTT